LLSAQSSGKDIEMETNVSDRFAIKAWKLMIELVEKYESELEDWEKEHIKSYKARMGGGRPLTAGQARMLNIIHGRRLAVLRRAADQPNVAG
jgi:hypothetical protein